MIITISGILTGVTANFIFLTDNAKTHRLIKEIQTYDEANTQFITEYNSLPGLITNNQCSNNNNFNSYCRDLRNINITTSDNIFSNNNCSSLKGCKIETLGKADGEDIIINFLTPMRYLQTAGYISSVQYGLDKQLSTSEKYSNKVWANSKLKNNVYVNIYNYYNAVGNKDYISDDNIWLFSGQNIFGHNTHSGNWYDHYYKLKKQQGQYLIYHRDCEIPKGALPSKIVSNVDVKIDDGKPHTGRLTTYATINTEFNNNEYSKCVSKPALSVNDIKEIDYNVNNDGFCNIAYELTYDNSISPSSNQDKFNYKNNYTKCNIATSDVNINCIKTIACSCGNGNTNLICSYEDGSSEVFEGIKEYDSGYNQIFKFTNNQICRNNLVSCDETIATNNISCIYQNNIVETFSGNCHYDNHTRTCKYLNGRYQRRQSEDEEGVCINHSLSRDCTFFDGYKVSYHLLSGYCSSDTDMSTCDYDMKTDSEYYCYYYEDGVVSNCISSSMSYCDTNQFNSICSTNINLLTSNFYCKTIRNFLVGNCIDKKTKRLYCDTNLGSDDNCGNTGCYACDYITLNNNFITKQNCIHENNVDNVSITHTETASVWYVSVDVRYHCNNNETIKYHCTGADEYNRYREIFLIGRSNGNRKFEGTVQSYNNGSCVYYPYLNVTCKVQLMLMGNRCVDGLVVSEGFCGSNNNTSTCSSTINANSRYYCAYYNDGTFENCIEPEIGYCTTDTPFANGNCTAQQNDDSVFHCNRTLNGYVLGECNRVRNNLLNGYCVSNTDASTCGENLNNDINHYCSYYEDGTFENCIEPEIGYCTTDTPFANGNCTAQQNDDSVFHCNRTLNGYVLGECNSIEHTLLHGYCSSNTDSTTCSDVINENSVYRCSYYRNGGIESCVQGNQLYCTSAQVAGMPVGNDCEIGAPPSFGTIKIYKCYVFDNYIGKCIRWK